jgi:hypothetical protein
MNINSDQFNQYMLAKTAFLKIRECGGFQSSAKIELTQEECKALLNSDVFNVDSVIGFVT